MDPVDATASPKNFLALEIAKAKKQEMEFVYVSPVDDDLICAICHDALWNPVEISTCEHVFCAPCAAAFMPLNSIEFVCPLCRSKFTKTQLKEAHRFIRNALGKLVVLCPQHKHGCTWQGPRSLMEDHVKTCGVVLLDCPYAHLGCRQKILRAKLQDHVMRECMMAQAPQELKTFVDNATKTIHDLRVQLEEKSQKPRDTGIRSHELDKKMMEIVWDTIQTAIAGHGDTVKGGAFIYDKGSPEQCHRLYYITCASLLNTTKTIVGADRARSYFWPLILERALEDAKPMPILWGTTDDAAWKLRRAFEAIKHGLGLRDSRYKSLAYQHSRFANDAYLAIASNSNLMPPLPAGRQ